MKPNSNHALYWILALSVIIFGIVVYEAWRSERMPTAPPLSPEQIAQMKKIEIVKSLSASFSSDKQDRRTSVVGSNKSSPKLTAQARADIINSLGNSKK
ncbi:MAG: hypothetical protein A3B11_00815 [Candidatus Taylorbacteria bacterium RIFCSPLOWO2_01_FULL_44_26]|uniref:Uncharacterized protein n=1 Tax=Candidatus Taylorbacteria bacterium RIFCSPLOWO2_01_FULL_44_26 TaxID=1802318 RepID=A0A1G2N687_9BACT|nr:MAG: hypothetical protein A3B11_00815 [Candidatus Taylorbacteria bacterium RIFCSPLOWO2_01_FULL_44_26]